MQFELTPYQTQIITGVTPQQKSNPERNVDLLQRTMQYILDHPEQHAQEVWFVNNQTPSDPAVFAPACGTAACFAGHALLLNGMTPQQLVDLIWDSNNSPRYPAQEVLGLTHDEGVHLFCGINTIPMLELMVKDLVNGDQLQDAGHYAKLTGEYDRLFVDDEDIDA